MKTAEMKFVVPCGWDVNVELMADGSRVYTVRPGTANDTVCHQQESIFKLVRASELSFTDYFLMYHPKTRAEFKFKDEVRKVIKAGVQDFFCPTLDPSFDGDERICYQAGTKPAIVKSYNWWYEHAKKYCPERKSRLGTKNEYIAFLAVLIKELVDSGKSLEWAWNFVCNDSKELEHYRNSSDDKHKLEATSNREVCGWCDLANTCKFLAKDNGANGFWLAGSRYYGNRGMADLYHYGYRCGGNVGGTGWIVLF